jgi:hypothetical protein
VTTYIRPLRTGYGKAVDQLVAALAVEFHDHGAYRNVAVIRVDDQTIVARGLKTNRLDGYGLTKAMVALARAEIRRLGHLLTLEDIDGLLHHAERHRAGACRCQRVHSAPLPMTGATNQRNIRARRASAGMCTRCGDAPRTNGTVCRECLTTIVAQRRAARAQARNKSPEEPIEELAY